MNHKLNFAWLKFVIKDTTLLTCPECFALIVSCDEFSHREWHYNLQHYIDNEKNNK